MYASRFLKVKLFFVGIDGSGKTTHARIQSCLLRRKGAEIEFKYYRGRFFFSIILIVLGYLVGLNYRAPGKSIDHRFYMNKAYRHLWPYVFLVDILFYLLLEKIKRFFRVFDRNMPGTKVIVYDRSIFDVIVDVCADTRRPELLKSIWFRAILPLLPEAGNSLLIYLDVKPNIAYSRKSDVPSVSYLKVRRAIYTILISYLKRLNYKVLKIDTANNSIPEVSAHIHSFIEAHLSKVITQRANEVARP